MTTENTRRRDILESGLAVLIEKGWRGTSMIAIARQANASKETLYNWFGDKTGFFKELIRYNATDLNQSLPESYDSMSLQDGLQSFGEALLRLLAGDASLAINRAAIADAGGEATLGRTLLKEGKYASMPALAAWLSFRLDLEDAAEAAETFVFLVKRDTQLERLLGVAPALDAKEITEQVNRAVSQFLKIYGS